MMRKRSRRRRRRSQWIKKVEEKVKAKEEKVGH
jgi:hypothetical protein